MPRIITHLDADGVCCASLIKMIPQYGNAYVYFSHPAGLAHDLQVIEDDDLIICDIAQDRGSFPAIYDRLKEISQFHTVFYFDHHAQPHKFPQKVINVFNQNISATELVYRYFYDQLPEKADHIALLGAICDYLDSTPLMQRLSHHYERRTLFLDAGLLAQGLKRLGRKNYYEHLRNLVQEFSMGKSPSEIKELTKAAISATISDNEKRPKIISQYVSEANIAWIRDPPSMSRSKIAHWILGHSGKKLGMVITTLNSKRNLVDITIRGWRLVDLRSFIPEIAERLGGSAGGHANAVGVRIPMKNLKLFLRIVDQHDALIKLPPIKSIQELIPLGMTEEEEFN